MSILAGYTILCDWDEWSETVSIVPYFFWLSRGAIGIWCFSAKLFFSLAVRQFSIPVGRVGHVRLYTSGWVYLTLLGGGPPPGDLSLYITRTYVDEKRGIVLSLYKARTCVTRLNNQKNNTIK